MKLVVFSSNVQVIANFIVIFLSLFELFSIKYTICFKVMNVCAYLLLKYNGRHIETVMIMARLRTTIAI